VRTPLTTGLQALAPLLPGMNLVGGKLLTRERMKPRGSLGHQWHCTAQHQGRRGAFPPGRPPFMVAMRAKELFQIIIGPRQLRDAIAVEQTRPITAADFEKMVDRRRERARAGSVPAHRPQQPLQAPLDGGLPELILVVQEVRRPLDPALGNADVGPQRCGRVQPAPQGGLQAPEGLGQGPLFSTRSRLSAMAVRRSWSLSPEAASGGWPSSVRALRTALQ